MSRAAPHLVQFASGGGSRWAGMDSYQLVSPDSGHRFDIRYEGEPPHGDSFHTGTIDGRPFPGYVWGCTFAWSDDSRILVFSWMARRFERLTVAVDVVAHRYFVLPEYLHDFRISWPSIVGEGNLSRGKHYTFAGAEEWLPY